MKKFLGMLVLVGLMTTAGAVYAHDRHPHFNIHPRPPVTGFRPIAKWLCEAYPVYSPGYFWWLSYSYPVSYQNALYACQRTSLQACNIWCRVVW